MSRIDEALRRATRSAGGDSAVPRDADAVPAPRRMDEIAIDLYPLEQGSRTAPPDSYIREAWVRDVASADAVSDSRREVRQAVAPALVHSRSVHSTLEPGGVT